MNITVNGKQETVPDSISIADYLAGRTIPAGQAVVECNRRIVARANYPHTALREGDSLEVVGLVGGG